MTYRIPVQDLSSIGDEQHGVRWSARIPVPISFIDDDPGSAFQSQFGRMQTGDQVRVCAFEPGTGAWRDGAAPVLEFAEYLVTHKIPAGGGIKTARLVACRIGDVKEIPKPGPADVVDGVLALDIVPVAGGNFEVRDRRGNVIEQFVDMKQAEEFRDREQNRPGVVGLSIRKGFGKFFVCKPDGGIVSEFLSKTEAEKFMQSGGQKAA